MFFPSFLWRLTDRSRIFTGFGQKIHAAVQAAYARKKSHWASGTWEDFQGGILNITISERRDAIVGNTRSGGIVVSYFFVAFVRSCDEAHDPARSLGPAIQLLDAGTLKQQPANVSNASACAQIHWHQYSLDI